MDVRHEYPAHTQEATVCQLIVLIRSGHGHVAELAAAIIARCCCTREYQEMVVRAGGLESLLSLLNGGSAKVWLGRVIVVFLKRLR